MIEYINFRILVPYIPNFITILVLLIAMYVVNSIISHSFRKVQNAFRKKFDISLSKFTIKTTINVIFALLIVVNIPGINETILRTLGYISAAVIAFANRSLIENSMAGMMIKLIKSYKPGDLVKIKGTIGQVGEVALMHTLIETPDKRIVYVPNSEVITGGITNFTKDHPLVKVKVGLGYDLNRLDVEHMLLNAAKRAGLKKSFVSVEELGDYAVTYVINGVLDNKTNTLPFIESNVRKNIIDEFHLAQKEILSPMYLSKRQAGKNVVPKKISKKKLLNKEEQERKSATITSHLIYKEAERFLKTHKR